MTRILKALKQLEWRSEDERASPSIATIDQQPAEPAAEHQLDDLQDLAHTILIGPPVSDQVTEGEAELDAIKQDLPESQPAPGPDLSGSREPTQFETTIRKSLDDRSLAKQYRQIADRILGELSTGCLSSALLCSTQPSKACSSLAAHLAVVFAERNDGPVLLIDGHLTDGTLTSYFDCVRENGLVEILNERMPLSATVRGTSIEGLGFLARGSGNLNDDATAAVRFGELLKDVSSTFRTAVVCSGAAGDLNVQWMSRSCDATYFHVELGVTKAADATQAIAQLRTAGSRVLGCVAS